MIVFLGQVDSRFLGREGFQEVDLTAFYRPITKWAVTAHRTDRITELVAQAVRISQAGRPGPVMIAFPADLLAADIDAAAVDLGRRWLGMDMAGGRPAAGGPSPDRRGGDPPGGAAGDPGQGGRPRPGRARALG